MVRDQRDGTPLEVLTAFLRLGCTSFGGPVAHIGYFRTAFVQQRGWLSEQSFADLLALCQFMPGPASSQLGMAIGLRRAGALGMLCAWIGFTLPSALLMAAFGYGVTQLGDIANAPWLRGLKLVAVAVVAQAVWQMARSLCPDRERATLAVAAATISLAAWGPAGQVGAIVLGAVAGLLFLRVPSGPAQPHERLLSGDVSHTLAIGLIAGFMLLLVVLPVLGDVTGDHALRMAAAFYRAGALVFGGGHVVLPLLQSAVVPPEWIGNDVFLAGYGAAQAVPGPLFTFAAFLGASMREPPHGWVGALLALIMIFLPSFLLVGGLLPVLGLAAPLRSDPVGAARHQRGGGRDPSRGALSGDVAPGRCRSDRLRFCADRVPVACGVERVAVDRGAARRRFCRGARHWGSCHLTGGGATLRYEGDTAHL